MLSVVVGALVCWALVAVGCGVPDDPSTHAVARVNGEVLVRPDVTRAVRLAKLSGETLTRAEALEDLICEELIRQEAVALGLETAATAVEARVEDLAESLGGAAALEQRLEAVSLSTADLRRGVRSAIVGEQLRADKYAGLAATRAEARTYYREHSDRFRVSAAVDMGAILVRAEGIAENAIERIRAGQPFENAARQFSIDPEGKSTGGRMGWVSSASLPEVLRAALVDMRVGELSEPIAFGSLWYVLKLYDRRSARTIPFAEAERGIRAALTGERQAEALAEWVAGARKRADVEILL